MAGPIFGWANQSMTQPLAQPKLGQQPNFGTAKKWPSQILAAGPVLGFSPTPVIIFRITSRNHSQLRSIRSI